MARKRLAPEQRHICAPASYPRVHDCGRQPWGPYPGPCTADPDSRAWCCEVPACPPADPPGSLWWVGEERELWRRGADGGIYDPRGVCRAWDQAMAELTRRGARLHYQAPAHPRWGTPRLRPHIDAPLVLVDALPAQLSLWSPRPR